jgi:hypothetical protein
MALGQTPVGILFKTFTRRIGFFRHSGRHEVANPECGGEVGEPATSSDSAPPRAAFVTR